MEKLENKVELTGEKNSEKLTLFISELDKNIFPDNTLQIKQLSSINAEASHNYEKDKDNNITEHYYAINQNINELKNENELSLFGIASHEVRHRVQLQILSESELFTKEKLAIVDTIDYKPFKELEDKKKKKLSEQLEDIVEDIENEKGQELSKNDYDAVIVATISRFLKYNEIPIHKIAKIINKNPNQIKQELEDLQ